MWEGEGQNLFGVGQAKYKKVIELGLASLCQGASPLLPSNEALLFCFHPIAKDEKQVAVGWVPSCE